MQIDHPLGPPDQGESLPLQEHEHQHQVTKPAHQMRMQLQTLEKVFTETQHSKECLTEYWESA